MKVETAASKSALVLGLSLRKKAFNCDQSISMIAYLKTRHHRAITPPKKRSAIPKDTSWIFSKYQHFSN
ncbi:hypothetical protein H6F44_08435 [Pseudanabaena sp. FACHB-1277]|jgi:hypothetical protein|uniref:Uncharacterized protein n=1 Tax=Pseudanabaena cinerea FACHB-1277 TaxID=2949581 RepID=A0A926USP7_9CYAN|nr:hypothetical protein [Pseudanabaena cinerea]MBD2150143.1 hypothetical protein [Pseudanabaena cinerea FACHB-1277]